ncbi:MAG TPA: ABC transporter permease [Firmicutes bacterium]|nr:ABC transporter permease [Bacillota bacterium]
MRALRMAWQQLTERKGMVLLMMVELTITLVAFNVFASRLGILFDLTALYESMEMERVWTTDGDTLQEQGAAIPESVTVVGGSREVTLLPPGESYNMSADNPAVYLWPSAFYEQFPLRLSEGEGMASPRQGCLNILIPRGQENRLRVGETYSRTVWYRDENDDAQTREVEIYVAGVLAGAVTPTPGGGVNERGTGFLGLDLSGVLEGMNTNYSSYYLRETESLTAEETAALQAAALPLEESYRSSRRSLMSTMQLPIILSIALLCFCLSAFLGYNLLSLLDREKRMAIYFLCGAKTREIVTVKLLHDALLVGLPMLLALAAMVFLPAAGLIASVSVPGILGSYLFVALIFGVSSAVFIRRLNQRSIVSYIHQWL